MATSEYRTQTQHRQSCKLCFTAHLWRVPGAGQKRHARLRERGSHQGRGWQIGCSLRHEGSLGSADCTDTGTAWGRSKHCSPAAVSLMCHPLAKYAVPCAQGSRSFAGHLSLPQAPPPIHSRWQHLKALRHRVLGWGRLQPQDTVGQGGDRSYHVPP